jgi:hypothetical protein
VGVGWAVSESGRAGGGSYRARMVRLGGLAGWSGVSAGAVVKCRMLFYT